MPIIPHTKETDNINTVSLDMKMRLISAHQSANDQVVSSAQMLARAAFENEKVSAPIPDEWGDLPASFLANRSPTDLGVFLRKTIPLISNPDAVADSIHLFNAFEKPADVLAFIGNKMEDVSSRFPTSKEDIECGRNPGDIIDPFLIAATQHLVCAGDFDMTIAAMVAHKNLMMIEGLMGHLHEDVVGMMRGNVRVPEPRGKSQSMLDPMTNPFPGADVVQPPLYDGDHLKFHQLKSKTGSAKGGDGIRLGNQLCDLEAYYGGQIYYDALIGNTLKGHRSRRAVQKAAPSTVVLVGNAAFKSLTRSDVGPQVLMAAYKTAFQKSSSYNLRKTSASIAESFRESGASSGYMDAILTNSTSGDYLDSRQD